MRRRGLGSVLLGFGAALAFIVGLETPWGQRLWPALSQFLANEAFYTQHSLVGDVVWRALREFADGIHGLFPIVLLVGCLATVAGVVARSVAWARVRDGEADPLDRMRSRPRLLRALTLGPAALILLSGGIELALSLRGLVIERAQGHVDEASWFLREVLAAPLSFGGLAALLYLVARAGARALVAPIETEAAPRKDAGEIVFSAVAVTARTRAAVGALAAATVAMVAFALTAASDPRFLWVLAAYVATAMAAPLVLRRVSRIAVGIDGVWVRDASQTRFFAYRDLDEARARGADLDLVDRGGRRVLRLQMHGDDAARRDEVVARVNDSIARSREGATRGAEMLMQAMPGPQVVATAMGAEGYRLPSISREQLWELVEGSTTDAATRAAAAEALAAGLDGTDRARLRIAASQCAEPRTRLALGALAKDSEEGTSTEEEGGSAPARLRAGAGGSG